MGEWTIHEDARERAKMCQLLSRRIGELEAENKRLREALEEIADLQIGIWGERGESGDIAFAALKGTSDG